jgi:hypothetical protein
VDDVERAREFYTELFGWEIKEVPGIGYWMITTTGEKAVSGGMMKRRDPRQTIIDYVGVSSVDEYIARVEELGGKVVVSKKALPGYGYFAVCEDMEWNVFGLWEDDKGA